MCLENLDPEFNITEGEGWKVFMPDENGKLYNLGYLHDVDKKDFFHYLYDTNTWISDPREYILPAALYQTGFHLFLNKEDAEAACGNDCCLRKVKFRNVTAKGTQVIFHKNALEFRDVPALAAREIFIEEEDL